jgi:hypothetical protein
MGTRFASGVRKTNFATLVSLCEPFTHKEGNELEAT